MLRRSRLASDSGWMKKRRRVWGEIEREGRGRKEGSERFDIPFFLRTSVLLELLLYT